MGFINFLISLTKTYWGGVTFLAIFVITAVLVMLLEKEKLRQHVMIWYSGWVLVFIYNPLTYLACKYVFKNAETFQQYYLRFYSLIPVFAIIAFGLTLLVSKLNGAKKFVAVLATIVLIAVAGDLVYSNDWFTKAENTQKVPVDVLELQEIFSERIANGETIKIMAPVDLAVYMRQVESKFSLPYTRNVDAIDSELISTAPKADAVLDYAAGKGVEYVISSNHTTTVMGFRGAGFNVAYETTNYVVYTLPPITWVLTQYPDDSGNQGMFYTMKNTVNGQLIVIDGGSRANETKVREVLEENDNHVDMWILTHYHADHIGAFNEIAGDPEGVVIDAVAVTPLDQEVFYERAQEWDDVDEYDAYLYAMSDASNVVTIYRGDHISLFDGLKISFYNAYDDVVLGIEDVPNNCSLVFKMETENRSVLFCADAHSEALTTYLMDTYGGELKADILQVGHHGHNSMPIETEFYVLVDPEIAMFDAPAWLMNNEDKTAKELAEYLMGEGVIVKDLTTAPNYYAFY